jgi:hypothetical protein
VLSNKFRIVPTNISERSERKIHHAPSIPSNKPNIQSLYSKQIKLIGCDGGTRKGMTEVIDMSKELKTRIWKIFTLDEVIT